MNNKKSLAITARLLFFEYEHISVLLHTDGNVYPDVSLLDSLSG